MCDSAYGSWTCENSARNGPDHSCTVKPHLIQKAHFQQIGRIGQFEWGRHDPKAENVEYSTAFVLCIPENAVVGKSPFELRTGKIQWLRVEEILWEELLNLYKQSKSEPIPQSFLKGKYHKGFADGAARILESVINCENTRREVEQALESCKNCDFDG
jgi:hypothetical protein